MRLFTLLASLTLAFAPSLAAGSALEPADAGGVVAIAEELRALGTNTRVLILGAHPDDEDTTMLAWVARGLGGDAAYLSLSRGEGGQNRYGTELGEGLGLLRSRELEAARRLDGAQQFFTRAYDFGFSKTLEETLAAWPEEELLRDAVRVVRRFRPQLIVAVFPASPAAGHGQHQAAGLVAERLLEAAADPSRFPELREEGLVPWRVTAVYRRAWRDPESATHRVEITHLEPFSGRSFPQIAMASRSLHRSQDMGQLEDLGLRPLLLAHLAGEAAPPNTDPLQNLDRRPEALAAGLPEGPIREEVVARLEAATSLASEALATLRPADPKATAPFLAEIVRHLDAAIAALRPVADADLEASWVLGELESRLAGATRAAAAAHGLVWDVFTAREAVVAGESLDVTVRIWNAGVRSLTLPELAVTLWSPSGWSEIQGVGFAAEPRETVLAPGELLERVVPVRLRAAVPPSAPGFLLTPRQGKLYDWSALPRAERGLPFSRPGLEARLAAVVDGTRLRLAREVVARANDQEFGEIRRPLRAVPALEVAVTPGVVVRRADDPTPTRLQVVVTNRSTTPRRGIVEALVPDGPISEETQLGPGERRTVELLVPAASATGTVEVAVRMREDDGTRWDLAVPLVDHPHIAPVPWPHRAEVRIATVAVVLPDLTFGWIRGPGEDLPERLAQLGARGRVLSDDDLASARFDGLDTIVIGTRAWETVPALSRANAKLLEWVRRGGRLITLYQRYPYFEGAMQGPEPMALTRPMARTVDETAPLRRLDPANALWSRPNPFEANDEVGWIQERGLFYPSTWGPSLRPFLALADPGEPEHLGALLVMRDGAGLWAYTGLAFFRQLPEGVPGAWRLFANLLALEPTDVPTTDPPVDPPTATAAVEVAP